MILSTYKLHFLFKMSVICRRLYDCKLLLCLAGVVTEGVSLLKGHFLESRWTQLFMDSLYRSHQLPVPSLFTEKLSLPFQLSCYFRQELLANKLLLIPASQMNIHFTFFSLTNQGNPLQLCKKKKNAVNCAASISCKSSAKVLFMFAEVWSNSRPLHGIYIYLRVIP